MRVAVRSRCALVIAWLGAAVALAGCQELAQRQQPAVSVATPVLEPGEGFAPESARLSAPPVPVPRVADPTQHAAPAAGPGETTTPATEAAEEPGSGDDVADAAAPDDVEAEPGSDEGVADAAPAAPASGDEAAEPDDAATVPDASPPAAPTGDAATAPAPAESTADSGPPAEAAGDVAAVPGTPLEAGAEEAAAAEGGRRRGTPDPELALAPDRFQASLFVIWDGNRTLPGLWLATPAVKRTMRARILNPDSGSQIDAIVYRDSRQRAPDSILVSSEAAEALNLVEGRLTYLSVFALRPRFAIGREARKSTAPEVIAGLAERIKAMSPEELLHLVAAALRGKGFATTFASPRLEGHLPSVLGFPLDKGQLGTQRVRAYIRPGSERPMTRFSIGALLPEDQPVEETGLVISVPGFADERAEGEAALRLTLDDLIDLWLTHHPEMPEPDRALLPLAPPPKQG